MRTVPIPGEILKTTVILGLSFDELLVLGSIPIVVVFPSLYIEQIPLLVSLGITAAAGVVVLGVIVRTPDGQSPAEWAPAAISRYFSPDEYYLKPKENYRARAEYMDVVHTADRLEEEATQEEITKEDVLSAADSSLSVDGVPSSPLEGDGDQ